MKHLDRKIKNALFILGICLMAFVGFSKAGILFSDGGRNVITVSTTKKTLKDAYGMKETSKNIGVIPNGAEWYEQVEVIEKKIVEEQNLDWVKWSDAEKTKLDSVSGVTITADTYIKAVEKALELAK